MFWYLRREEQRITIIEKVYGWFYTLYVGILELAGYVYDVFIYIDVSVYLYLWRVTFLWLVCCLPTLFGRY